MKVFIAFAFLVAGISAFPSLDDDLVIRDSRLVTDSIVNAIKDVSQSIKGAGLDPLQVSQSASYALPVPVIFNAAGEIVDLLSNGLSNIVVNRINFSLVARRLTFDIELPLISASVESCAAKVIILGDAFETSISGSVAIQSIRVRGTMQIGVGVISGIYIRSLSINFALGGINSNLKLVIQGTDFSNVINTVLGVTIPSKITAFKTDIDELLRIIMLDYINENL